MTVVVRSIAEVREKVAVARLEHGQIGLVPTMGALHSGHGCLIQQARRESGFVVVSIFVNPLQFGPSEDFNRYPRTLETDREYCEKLGVDLIFFPEVSEMYPREQVTTVEVSKVTEGLCGRFRPGHFRGVTTVVLKLLNIVQPDAAYFGEKDAQQLKAIERMVLDLNLPVAIRSVATVREADGLAMSSRNKYLSPEQRSVAGLLYKALRASRDRIAAGERNALPVRETGLALLAGSPLIRVQYYEIVDAETMLPVQEITGTVRIAAAVFLGTTRLIDNVLCEVH